VNDVSVKDVSVPPSVPPDALDALVPVVVRMEGVIEVPESSKTCRIISVSYTHL
tara:strand:+ start:1280 stop:1441 length:162 start_codon:yes stop_codon:yes gene_type:complete